MDILDLFNGAANPGKSAPSKYKAPIELMSEFLIQVTSSNFHEALVIADQILEYEPENKIILEYHQTLKDYVNNNNNDEDDSDSEASSDDSDDSEDDSSDEEDDDDDNEEVNDIAITDSKSIIQQPADSKHVHDDDQHISYHRK